MPVRGIENKEMYVSCDCCGIKLSAFCTNWSDIHGALAGHHWVQFSTGPIVCSSCGAKILELRAEEFFENHKEKLTKGYLVHR